MRSSRRVLVLRSALVLLAMSQVTCNSSAGPCDAPGCPPPALLECQNEDGVVPPLESLGGMGGEAACTPVCGTCRFTEECCAGDGVSCALGYCLQF